MGIALASNFDVNTGLPLDSRTVVADLTARDAIPALQRYEGLSVYVEAEETTYRLIGGITNGDWQVDGGGAVGPLENSGTGVVRGMGLTINGGNPAQFDIALGVYEVLDTTDPVNPVLTLVEYAGSTGNIVTNLASQDVTYILMDSAGLITQQLTYPTPTQRRAKCFLGRLNHSNRTSISFVNFFPDFKLNLMNQFYDLLDALAPFKIKGLDLSTNGANLSFNKSSGTTFFRSDNLSTDNQNPHYKAFTAQTLQPFRKITQTTTVDVSDVTVIDPANYDVAGTVTAVPGAGGTATVQRVYQYKSGAVRVAYGQTSYNNITTAVSAIATETFVPNPTIEASAILIGYIVVAKSCTSLLDVTKCKIVPAARFDAVGGSAGADNYGGTVSVINDLAVGWEIPIDTSIKSQTYVISALAASNSSTNTPFGSTVPVNGAEITLIGADDTLFPKLASSNTAKGYIGPTIEIFRGETVTVKYIDTLDRYVLKSKSN